MATAAKLVIAEVEEVEEIGNIDPDIIKTPSAFVDKVVLVPKYEKRIDKLVTESTEKGIPAGNKSVEDVMKERIAARVAKFLKSNETVHLGSGIPYLVANFIPKDLNVKLFSESGLIGV